jgi:hypothetical protein
MFNRITLTALLLSIPAFAQESAGGLWIHNIVKDPMTDAKSEVFVIASNNHVGDSLTGGEALIQIECAHGHYMSTTLQVPDVIGMTWLGPLDRPQQMVDMRLDGKLRVRFWNISSNHHLMFMDNGTAKELLRHTDVRISYFDALKNAYVAAFSPAGLERGPLVKACGKIFQ